MTRQWSQLEFKAMNTNIFACLYSHAKNSDAILRDVQRMFNSMEDRMSRFKPDSELSRLNRSTGAYPVSLTLYDVIEASVWAAEATLGLFDPTILPNLKAAGYSNSFDDFLQLERVEIQPAQPCLGRYRQIGLNLAKRTVELPGQLQLDLGGIGKGWTVDRVSDRLTELGPYLVNAGGDIFAHGAPPGLSGWPVTITDPRDQITPLANIQISHKAIATSSITRRSWSTGTKTNHHLIDPRTGQSADTDLLTVTVISDRCSLAEIFAKTALILGSEEGLAYLNDIPHIEGFFVTQTGECLETTNFNHYREPEVNYAR